MTDITKFYNGTLLDPATAEWLGEWSNGFHRGDTRWVHETLHRAGTQYFLRGEGGFRTRYARRAGQNCWYPVGEAIVPITERQARTWAEEHLDGRDAADIFDDPRETAVIVRLDDTRLEALDREAGRLGLTRKQTILKAIDGLRQ